MTRTKVLHMKYKIVNEELVFDDHFKIKKATILHDTFSQSEISIDRLCFERGDSVAIILFERDTNSLLFTNQFRYPSIKEGDGWILELTAGSLEVGDDPEDRVKKEVEEEIGYQLEQLEFVISFFVSPGGTSERILLYYSEVLSTSKTMKGGGSKYEKEDIELVKTDITKAEEWISQNKFRDAKTIIGLQWFFANKAG